MSAMPQPELDSRELARRACEEIRDRGVRHGVLVTRKAVIEALRDAKLYDAVEVVIQKLGPVGDLK